MEVLGQIAAAFTPMNILFAAVGVLIGMIVGILPGLTSTMTLALFTPFALVMSPEQGLALMLGVYVAVMLGGDITAILINTPGTPASVVVTFDGYPMTQQGRAGLALGLNVIAGTFGNLFGIAVLALIALPLSRLALRFNSPEYFALAVFGLTMMVSVSGKSLIKGFLAGLFGMAVASVGIDPISGYPRFTFGNLALLGGVTFVPFMIGLFGVSEVLNQMLEHAGEFQAVIQEAFGRLWPSRVEARRLRLPLLISGVVGVFVGALPGAGGDIASLISWDQCKRISKQPAEFGRGSIEGLTAAATANNSVIGGTMATMLTLGLPGDANTAVLIGTLLMWGLRPGPLFFRDHLHLFYLIIGTLVLSSLLSALVATLRIRTLAEWITRVKKHHLWATILVLCIVGSYALNNSVQDIWIMLLFGVVGLVLRRLDFPLGPVVLGVILGPIAESNLRRTLTVSGGDVSPLFTQPIAATLLLLSLAAVASSLWQRRRAGRSAIMRPETGDRPDTPDR